jgi:hypothetical protein
LKDFANENRQSIFMIFFVCVIVASMGLILIKGFFPEITYRTYEITGFYIINDENYCAFTKDEDGGEKMMIIPIEKTVIYPSNDSREYVEIEIAEEGTRLENTITVKAYISKTLDEVERIK